MGIIFKCAENMGSFHWETTVHLSQGEAEVSFMQTWFDDSKVLSKQNVILTVDELRDIMRRIENKK